MNRTENPRKVLGKGLNALLAARTQAPPPAQPPATAPEAPRSEDALYIPINAIDANPLQPRRVFQPDRLSELAQSIRANGIVQPIVVRRAGDRYQLVAGERRWRAAKLAGLDQVPVVVRDIPDERLLEITLIENIQREDLNAIETAVAFDRLGQELNLTAEQIGERTGKDRTTILNFIRLLQLPTDLQQLVAERRLSQGHARCLLSLPTQELQREVAEKAVAQGWSVRQTERTTQKMIEGRKAKHVDEVQVDPNVKAAISELERALGTKVRIVEKPKRGGRIEIEYYSADDLDRIYSAIVKE
jgi:ParB family transcriptional regulator, chromosome partitioning protein